MGVEGGHMIESSPAALRIFQELGARYLTLTHLDDIPWADSATDRTELHGLSEFGKKIVRELNRIGVFADISHVSPDAMLDALHVTRAPVIFSHSNARADRPARAQRARRGAAADAGQRRSGAREFHPGVCVSRGSGLAGQTYRSPARPASALRHRCGDQSAHRRMGKRESASARHHIRRGRSHRPYPQGDAESITSG